MNILKKIIVAASIVMSLIVPQQVSAQNEQCNDLKQQFQNAGGSDVISTLPEYCSVGSLYTKFLNLALYAIGIVAVIVTVYGGYLYMTAGGNEAQRKKGSTVLTWAVAGVIVVLIASVLVNVILRAVVENRFV